MKIGVPREMKPQESRVALTPQGVREFVCAGHTVIVERGAGLGSSILDDEFAAAGAQLAGTAAEVWRHSEMVLKVKEPIATEYPFLRAGLVLFTYLHLASSRECTEALIASGATAIAYETVQLADGTLPLLHPMSEIAGRMAPQVGAYWLQRPSGGRGVLLGGVSGVQPANVVIIGGGVAGSSAADCAVGLGGRVFVLDTDIKKLRHLDEIYRGRLTTVTSNRHEVENLCLTADLVIGAVLVTGAKAPLLVSNELVKEMKPGSVLVDIAIDQGGCFEDSRPTTHADPVYRVHDSTFYCVANMPGAVPNTSTYALTNATLPYALEIANHGLRESARADPGLRRGINVVDHRLTSEPVAVAHGLPFTPIESLVG